MSLAVVRDLREARSRRGRMSWRRWRLTCWPGLSWPGRRPGWLDATVRSDVAHLEQVRAWFGRPLWDMEPADADAYFGKVLRDAVWALTLFPRGFDQVIPQALAVFLF